MSINHRSSDVAMAEKSLDCADVVKTVKFCNLHFVIIKLLTLPTHLSSGLRTPRMFFIAT